MYDSTELLERADCLELFASDLVVARKCCMARMLPGEADLVSE